MITIKLFRILGFSRTSQYLHVSMVDRCGTIIDKACLWGNDGEVYKSLRFGKDWVLKITSTEVSSKTLYAFISEEFKESLCRYYKLDSKVAELELRLDELSGILGVPKDEFRMWWS